MRLFKKNAQSAASARPEFNSRRNRAMVPQQKQSDLFEGSKAFRRSSSLTGTSSARIKVAAEERGQLQTARMEAQKKHNKQRKIRHRLFVVFGLAVLAVIVWANTVKSYAVIYSDQTLALTPPKAAYQQTAQKFTQAHFAAHFMVSLPREALAKDLMAQHPEIQKVTVKSQMFSRNPQLFIAFRQPVLLWKTSKQQQSYYVDSQGKAFDRNVFGKDDALVKVNDASGIPAELGSAVVSSRQIKFLGVLVGQVQAKSAGKIKVNKITFPASSTKEVDVNFTDKPYFARVYLDRAPEEQASEINTSINYLTQKNITPAEYIDVRVKDRVFYR